MGSRLRIALATALLVAVFSPAAYAQGYRVGDLLIPESSIEYSEDIGMRAHTNLQILVGPGHGIRYDGGLGPGGGMTPAQLRAAYSLPSTGGSQIIAVVDAYDDPDALADFNTFSAQFGLPQEPSSNATASTNTVFQVVYGSGKQPRADRTGGWETEEAMDIEWAHAMAPNAKVILVEAQSTSFTDLLTAVAMATDYVDSNGLSVKEVSNSWSSSEFSGENRYDTAFTSNNVVYFFASGDTGAPAEYPSASPYVISVGGTTVNTDNSGAFTGEVGWNGSGGGPSAYEPRPSFQSGISGIVGSWRGTPDLCFDADPNTGVSIYDSFPAAGQPSGWSVAGGTSLCSPALAGIANLAATAAGSFPAGGQALLATIYNNLGTANFRDITTGNNGYPAAVGWDFVTGIGSCVGLAGLQSTPPAPSLTSLSPSSATAGGAAFTLTVNGTRFVSGVTISWNGVALTTTLVSSTQVTALVPAADIVSAGTSSITATNPGSTASGVLVFTISGVANPKPVLATIGPASVRRGSSALTITLTGSSFLTTSVVQWISAGTTTALATTYTSPTKLTATVTSALLARAGTTFLRVSNPAPGGGTSAVKTFTVR